MSNFIEVHSAKYDMNTILIPRIGIPSIQLVMDSIPKRCDGGRLFGTGAADRTSGDSIRLNEVQWIWL